MDQGKLRTPVTSLAEKPIKLPSDRSFGLTFAAMFTVLQVLLLARGKGFSLAACTAAVGFLAISFTRPAALHQLNRAWMKLADVLNRIFSPVFLGILYFGLLTPFAIIRRLSGADPLRLALDSKLPSYWGKRADPQLTREGLKRQF
jgi:hypothetical protein